MGVKSVQVENGTLFSFLFFVWLNIKVYKMNLIPINFNKYVLVRCLHYSTNFIRITQP